MRPNAAQQRKRAAQADRLLQALTDRKRLTPDEQLKMIAALDASITAISKGQAETGDWRNVFDVVNLLRELFRAGQAKDWEEWIDAIEEAIDEVMARRLRGTVALRADELKTLHDMRATWAQIMDRATKGEIRAAEQAVILRVKRVLGSKDADVTYVGSPP